MQSKGPHFTQSSMKITYIFSLICTKFQCCSKLWISYLLYKGSTIYKLSKKLYSNPVIYIALATLFSLNFVWNGALLTALTRNNSNKIHVKRYNFRIKLEMYKFSSVKRIWIFYNKSYNIFFISNFYFITIEYCLQ
jgi:hypothetical protein